VGGAAAARKQIQGVCLEGHVAGKRVVLIYDIIV
jgi:hypothetical protein